MTRGIFTTWFRGNHANHTLNQYVGRTQNSRGSNPEPPICSLIDGAVRCAICIVLAARVAYDSLDSSIRTFCTPERELNRTCSLRSAWMWSVADAAFVPAFRPVSVLFPPVPHLKKRGEGQAKLSIHASDTSSPTVDHLQIICVLTFHHELLLLVQELYSDRSNPGDVQSCRSYGYQPAA